MAHAGTPMDLAKQPATTGSNGFWRALVTAIVVVTIAVGLALGAAFIAGAKPAADNSYNRIEDIRGAAPLTVGPVDRSYNAVEGMRGGAAGSSIGTNGQRGEAAGSGGSVDLNQLTAPRGNMTLSGTSVDQGAAKTKGLHGSLP
jgi:hypothetical protein